MIGSISVQYCFLCIGSKSQFQLGCFYWCIYWFQHIISIISITSSTFLAGLCQSTCQCIFGLLGPRLQCIKMLLTRHSHKLVFMHLEHKNTHKQHMYICSNNQQYCNETWVSICKALLGGIAENKHGSNRWPMGK